MQQIQGIEAIRHVASALGGLGRYEDTYMVHATEGETVIPMEVLDRDPLLKERLFESMREMGIDPERYIVGNELNSRNPVTGQPEFFLKQLKKIMKSPWAQAAAGMFLPGGPLIPMGMEALAGGEMKDIFHAGVRGGGGRLGGDWLRQASMTKDWFPNVMGSSGDATNWYDKLAGGDWWTGLKEKMWKSPEDVSFTKRWDIIQQGKKVGLEYGKEGAELAAFVQDYTDKELAKLASSGILQNIGANLMKDPLQTALVGGLGFGQYQQAKMYNEALEQQREEDKEYPYKINLDVIEDVLDSDTPLTYPDPVIPVAEGGIMKAFPRQQGGISGPGTGTSDDIPAMLSDGEFVMTADAVKGAGGGSRASGTRKMYDLMNQFERRS
jgi:hypothetical protein